MGGMNKKQDQAFTLVGIGIAVGFANFWHVFSQWRLNPQDRFFTWIAHYYADYFLYVSQIAQGVRGSWLWSKSLYTNEYIPDTWIYWPNVLMGRIGSIVTDSPFIIYSMSLALLVAILLYLLAAIATKTFPRHPVTAIVAFLFCSTASNFIDIPGFFRNGTLALTHSMWFSPTPALNRLGGVPHQTLQTVLLLCVVLLSAQLMDTKKPHRIAMYLFITACFLTATISPIQMLIVAISMSAVLLLLRPGTQRYFSIGAGLGAAALGAILVNRAFDTSALYTAAKAWEAAQTVRGNMFAMFLALGPVIILIPFGIRQFLRNTTPLRTVLMLYGALSLVLFVTPVPALLGTSPTRWIHPASLVVWYLIAAEGWRLSAPMAVHLITKNIERRKIFTHYFSFLVLVIYITLTIPAILSQIISRSSFDAAPVLYSDLNHVPTNVIHLFSQIKHSDGAVLVDPALPYDGLAPILTGNKSFTGHPVHTLYPEVKEQLRRQFFSGRMTETEARQFIHDHDITTVVYAHSTKPHSPLYSFLTESFDNDTATLYEITR